MTIGILKLFLFIQESNSLKEKRMVMHSVKARLRNNFNVAVAQIDDEDKWQRATLAVIGVERNRSAVNSSLSRIVNFIEHYNHLNLLDYEIELF